MHTKNKIQEAIKTNTLYVGESTNSKYDSLENANANGVGAERHGGETSIESILNVKVDEKSYRILYKSLWSGHQ